MKQRVISGVVIAIITIFTVYFGGWYFKAVAAFFVCWGSYEFAKCRKRDIHWFEFISILISTFLIAFLYEKAISVVLSLLVVLTTIAIFDEEYGLEDACASLFETILLGYAVHELLSAQAFDKWLLGYILVITYLTDVFALFAGMKFGKHKLNERISPKKTIEGAIGGWLCDLVISFAYAAYFNFFGFGILNILICSVILPIVSQIGDLAFSLIKRHYGVKDFSKLIPGHGGLLDRYDSLLFVLIIFSAIKVVIGL